MGKEGLQPSSRLPLRQRVGEFFGIYSSQREKDIGDALFERGRILADARRARVEARIKWVDEHSDQCEVLHSPQRLLANL